MVVQGEKRWTWDWGRVEERCLGVEVGRVALAVRERPRCERSTPGTESEAEVRDMPVDI